MINWIDKFNGYGYWTSGSSSASSTDEDTESESTTTTSSSSTSTSQLVLDDDAIESYVDDMLSDTDGLADIFTAENTAGLYDSTVSESSTSDLIANITGELAELTGTTVTTDEEEEEESTESSSSTDTDSATITGSWA